MFQRWIKSSPFDLGNTTRNGLVPKGSSRDVEDCEINFNRVLELNKKSRSNGCLMRITPLAVWCCKLTNDSDV